jgi:NrS-1  polymerase HBD domain/AAA domain
MSETRYLSAPAVALPALHPREPYDLFDAIAQHEPGVDPGEQCVADLALCQTLVREHGADPERIDRLFRQGQRMRPMWDQPVEGGDTYGRRLVAIAIRMEAPRPDADGCTAGIPAGQTSTGTNAGGTAGADATPDDPTAPELLSRLASDIGEEIIEWLWPGVLAFGSVAVLDGHPGVGKSTLAIDIAARLSRGEEMPRAPSPPVPLSHKGRGGVQRPEAFGESRSPSNLEHPSPLVGEGPGVRGSTAPRFIMIASAEDHTARTIRPRLRIAGADMKRVRVVDEVRVRSGPNAGSRPLQLPDDLALLEKKMTADGTRLLILDPLMAFLGCDRRGRRIDAHKDQSVRQLLVQLKGLAERTGACILVIRHLSKGMSRSALLRGSGSIGITASGRTVLLAGRHPDDPMLRALAVVKTNLGALPLTLTYRVIGAAAGSRIEWADDCDLGADDLLRPADKDDKKPTRQREAEAFLKDLLKDGVCMPADDVLRRASECGVAATTLARAAKELGVQRFRKGKAWFWEHDPLQVPPMSGLALP